MSVKSKKKTLPESEEHSALSAQALLRLLRANATTLQSRLDIAQKAYDDHVKLCEKEIGTAASSTASTSEMMTREHSASYDLAITDRIAVQYAIRDWILETLLWSTKTTSGPSGKRQSKTTTDSTPVLDSADTIILQEQWWTLLGQVMEMPTSKTLVQSVAPITMPALPIIMGFISLFPTHLESHIKLRSDTANEPTNPRKLITAFVDTVFEHKSKPLLRIGLLRKATVDQVLESHATILKSSARVHQALTQTNVIKEDPHIWEIWNLKILRNWLRGYTAVLGDAGKAGAKKISQHSLLTLAPMITLMYISSASSENVHAQLLNTIQQTVFNPDNLKRGMARETYNNTTEADRISDGADGELLARLTELVQESPNSASVSQTAVHAALPELFAIFMHSLEVNASTLFPLPANKSNYPTPSAARSAFELWSLDKRRVLAGRWIENVCKLLNWSPDPKQAALRENSARSGLLHLDETKATCLRKHLETVRMGNLIGRHLDSIGWRGVEKNLVQGAVLRLKLLANMSAESSSSETTDVRHMRRDALLSLLTTIIRLRFSTVNEELNNILECLAMFSSQSYVMEGPSSSTSDSVASEFISECVAYHSRSGLLPSLLSRFASALSVAAHQQCGVPNSLLTMEQTVSKLENSIRSMVHSGSEASWLDLVAQLETSLNPNEDLTAKRVKREDNSADIAVGDHAYRQQHGPSAASARVRILTLLARSMPSPVLVDQFKAVKEAHIDPSISRILVDSKKKKKKRKFDATTDDLDLEVMLLGELLLLRYAMVQRMRLARLQSQLDSDWKLQAKDQETLMEALLRRSSSLTTEFQLIASRTLLQHCDQLQAQPREDFLTFLMSQVTTVSSNGRGWRGYVRGIDSTEFGIAIWALITKRYLGVYESYGTSGNLDALTLHICKTMTEDQSATPGQDSMNSLTRSLLSRADFYELPRLRSHLQKVLLSEVAPEITGEPEKALQLVNSNALKAELRESILTGTPAWCRTLDDIRFFFPLEYLAHHLRQELVGKVLALDILISGTTSLQSSNLEKHQLSLRCFLLFAQNQGKPLPDGVNALRWLSRHVQLDETSSSLLLELLRIDFRNVTADALNRTGSSEVCIMQYLSAWVEEILMQRNSSKSNMGLAFGQLALLSICDILLQTSSRSVSSNPIFGDQVRNVLNPIWSGLIRIISLATSGMEERLAMVPNLPSIIAACRTLWAMENWNTHSTHDAAVSESKIFPKFAEISLSYLLSTHSVSDNDFTCRIALLDLLGYRVLQLRHSSDPGKVSTAAFEAYIACHLAFRQQSTVVSASVESSLTLRLKKVVCVASLQEYAAVIQAISAVIAAKITCSTRGSIEAIEKTCSLSHILDVTLVLLCNGPEGSSRVASTGLSEMLRHLCYLLLPQSQTISLGHTGQDLLAVAKFLEGLCGERPMLLSRQNVSSILTLLSYILSPGQRPSPEITGSIVNREEQTTAIISATLTSNIYTSLVLTVDHLVRHRKDHITPLFPILVNAIIALLNCLRISGFVSTSQDNRSLGNKTVAPGNIEKATPTLASLGRKAERDVKIGFPYWVYEGGHLALGRKEAMSMGRLLSSLSGKTATRMHKSSKSDQPNGVSSRAARGSSREMLSLTGPLSKHSPFLLLSYLHYCVHPTAPIPGWIRTELQVGWWEVLDTMGKWEKECLMRGLLRQDEEVERGLLREMWKAWEKEKYIG